MILQISPNYWSCLATSFAMALDVPVRELFKEIGHNGHEIIFPMLEEPHSRRSFHPQEFVEPALKRGFAIVQIEAEPILGFEREFYVIKLPGGNEKRLTNWMQWFPGVVCGEDGKNKPHAMAWDKERFYDPNGIVVDSVPDFLIRYFFAIVKSNQEK